MAEDSLESSAQVLVSLREGSLQRPSPPRRGYPPRIRKKNQRFYNSDEETDYSPVRTPKKQAKLANTPAARPSSVQDTTVSETPEREWTPTRAYVPIRPFVPTPDKRIAQSIGTRLRNLLKLPKAHKWVCYEFFYSNLDAPLFLGENDFNVCLQESFPQLKTKRLTRVEWCKIRRLMGKPRRCSSSFFLEERKALHGRRDKIRLLQQRKMNDLSSLKDMPEEIPLHLVIGTKVTDDVIVQQYLCYVESNTCAARLRKPQDGLFTGTIEALDTLDNTYRVTFDRPGLGTHSIPDYEVLSKEPADTIPITAFQHRQRQRQGVFSPPKFVPGSGISSTGLENDTTSSSGAPFQGRLMSLEGGTYGGFPIKFLVLVTRLSKILKVKKDWVTQLREKNTEAEKMLSGYNHTRGIWGLDVLQSQKSYQEPITVEFQRNYANIVLELSKLNKDLSDYLLGVHQFCQELAPEQGLQRMEEPSEVKKRCDQEADDTVSQICQTMFSSRKTSKNERVLRLVKGLTSLMLQIRTFSESDFNSFEFRSLQDSLKEIKNRLDPNNINAFLNNVEIHISHIQSGLSQMGNLHAFSASLQDV